MSVDKHREAEAEWGRADAAKTAGDYASAAIYLANGALAENAAFDAVPAERQKTRGVLAISVVSSYLQASYCAAKAGEQHASGSYRETAELYVRKYLGMTPIHPEPPLADWAIERLRTIVADTDAEYAAEEARRRA